MITEMTRAYRELLVQLGENPDREGLVDTPKRAAKALEFLTSGYRQDLETIVNGAVFSSDTDEMVVVRDIELYSMCEHHMLPFTGRCHIGYLPNGKVLGLSKFARITDMFARRLQIQEALTRQIALAVREVTGARGVAVADHRMGYTVTSVGWGDIVEQHAPFLHPTVMHREGARGRHVPCNSSSWSQSSTLVLIMAMAPGAMCGTRPAGANRVW